MTYTRLQRANEKRNRRAEVCEGKNREQNESKIIRKRHVLKTIVINVRSTLRSFVYLLSGNHLVENAVFAPTSLSFLLMRTMIYGLLLGERSYLVVLDLFIEPESLFGT